MEKEGSTNINCKTLREEDRRCLVRGKKNVISMFEFVIEAVAGAIVPTSIRVVVESATGVKVELRLFIPDEGIFRVLGVG